MWDTDGTGFGDDSDEINSGNIICLFFELITSKEIGCSLDY